ncbi:uncharacterized protein H6S33_009064 [Morchella sextelata]|uniref:uncharacterized protein n=1 Tax=Morchella sextelata TaxID=1174677 RepID=UPI001D043F27|nr:uncharacterized protein H6S33_009064 [Morchella sextelata]KAH0612684.1 hypothetical protein H6S33_009064 [Morchella sextelata]
MGVKQPKGWKDASAISEEFKGVKMMDVDQGLYQPVLPAEAWIPDNEYIVYSVSQVKLRYLFKVQFSH